ncbi:MAG: hypothetical protein CM15mP51_05550 [Porticoccaceae bacterium]|nr:MAG: hypothetical protein CM15mP51_05550 [Porticoccaceae bacterium]
MNSIPNRPNQPIYNFDFGLEGQGRKILEQFKPPLIYSNHAKREGEIDTLLR